MNGVFVIVPKDIVYNHKLYTVQAIEKNSEGLTCEAVWWLNGVDHIEQDPIVLKKLAKEVM